MKYVLNFLAHLENISELELDVGANNHNVGLYLKVNILFSLFRVCIYI